MRLSIVIPCCNEAANVPELYRRLDAVVAAFVVPERERGRGGEGERGRDGERESGEEAFHSAAVQEAGRDVEFIFVDDGSRDGTLERLRELATADPRVQVIALSRNFGHQAALTAGIDHAGGEAVVLMDADLQHPPELIPRFIEKWQDGFDLVYAYREGIRPRLGYRIVNALMKIQIPAESADFRLMDRRVVEAFRQMPERARFIRGMISWLGFRQTGIGYRQHDRHAGRRTYTLRQTGRMALNAVLSFSSIPLRMASLLGLITLAVGVLYAMYILYARLAGWPIEIGWTSLILTVLILGGVQLLCLGIIAEYIGRIFEEVKHRPLYVVRETIAGKNSPRRQRGTEKNIEYRMTNDQ